MATGILDIEPRELKFIVEPKKLSECTIQLRNKSDQYVAFKIKTTSPKKYCVRPNLGVINPRETCDFTVTMQAQRSVPSDLHCKDKFLVQSTVVPTWMNEEDLPSDTFARDGDKFIEDKKMRVVLINAPISPAPHPADGELKQDANYETPAQKDTSQDPNFETPAQKYTLQDPNYETPAQKDTSQDPNYETAAQKDTSQDPNYGTPAQKDISQDPTYETPAQKDVSQDPTFGTPAQKDVSQDPTFGTPAQKDISQDPTYETPAQKDRLPIGVENIPPQYKDVKGLVTVNEIDMLETPLDTYKPVLAKDNKIDELETPMDLYKPVLAKNLVSFGKDMDDESRAAKDSEILEKGKDTDDKSRAANDSENLEKGKDMDDEARAAKGVDPFKSVLEMKMPKTVAEVRAKKAIARTFEFMEKIKPGLDSGKFRLAHDLGVLKSKNIVMDTKLREAELTMKKLMEERSVATRDNDNLKHEIEIMRKGNVRKVEVGFPLLYVCSVALISITFGYLFHF